MAIKSQDNKKIMVVIISILLAFFLWLYVMSENNPITQRTIPDVPVVLTNPGFLTDENLTLVPDQTFSIDLSVSGRAMDIYNLTVSQIKLEADLSGSLKKGTNNIPIKIISIPKGITLSGKNGIPYITVNLDALVQKSVPVTVNIQGTVEEGYGYTDPVMRPDVVLVSGPEAYVKSVKRVTGQVDIGGNYNNISASIPVIPQDKNGITVTNVTMLPKLVDVTVSIKPSKEVPVKVYTFGTMNDSKVLKSIKPQTSKVIIIGDKKYLNNINEIYTQGIDLSKINDSGTVNLSLNVPAGVSVQDNISSINVDLSVENKVQKVIETPIAELNPGSVYDYLLSPDTVSVQVVGPESIVNPLNKNSITATIDLYGLEEGSYSLPVSVGEIQGVELNNISPEKVSVMITKK